MTTKLMFDAIVGNIRIVKATLKAGRLVSRSPLVNDRSTKEHSVTIQAVDLLPVILHRIIPSGMLVDAAHEAGVLYDIRADAFVFPKDRAE